MTTTPRDGLYTRLCDRLDRHPRPCDRAAFDVAYNVTNNNTDVDIETLYTSILFVVDQAHACGYAQGYNAAMDQPIAAGTMTMDDI